MDLSDASHPEGVALPLEQHDLYERLLRYLGHRTQRYTLRQNGSTAGTVLMSRPRRGLPFRGMRAVRGPVWSGGIGIAEKHEGMRQLNREGLRIVSAESPADAAALASNGYVRAGPAAKVWEVDLRPGFAALVHRMSPTVRSALAEAEAGHTLFRNRQFDSDRDGWLLRASHQPRAMVRKVTALSLLSPTATRLLTVEQRDDPVAALMLVLHAPVATVLFTWERRNPPVPGAREEVLRGTLRTLAGSGFERLDLGALDAEPAALDRGLAIGIGARDRVLGGRWVRWPGRGL